MTRRNFLSSLGIAAASPLIAQRSGEAPAIASIDTHTHFYDPRRPQGVPWPKPSEKLLYAPFLPADFRAASRSSGVAGTIVVEASPWAEDNQWLLDLAPDTPEIVAIVGNLKFGQPEFRAQLKRFSAHTLFRGLRVGTEVMNAQGTGAIATDLRRVADAGLSLDVIGRSAIVAPTAALAEALPGLKIVVNHLPFPEWDGRPADLHAALAPLAATRNVYIKVSDVVRRVGADVITDPAYYQPGLDVLFTQFGPERLIYASNWPVSERVAPYAVVHRVVADYFSTQGRAAAEQFFWRNSRTAYAWERSEIAQRLSP